MANNRCWKCGKVIFASFASAERAARDITKTYGRKKKHRMRAYRGRCGKWHLTRTKTMAEWREHLGLDTPTHEQQSVGLRREASE